MTPTADQLEALKRLWEVADRHRGTSGGNTAGKFLLGLYNGYRFPFDLTDCRLLDARNMAALLSVLLMDSQPQAEVHVLLDRLYGCNEFGLRFEVFAYEMRLKGAAKKSEIEDCRKRLKARTERSAAVGSPA